MDQNNLTWNVEKSRQQRSRLFAVLTYSMYAPRSNTKGSPCGMSQAIRALRDAASNTAALLDGLF